MSSGHLTSHEIEQLSRETDPRSGDGWSHVENCPQCKTLLAKYQAVGARLDKLASMRSAPKPGTNCPDEQVWFEVAAGTLPSEESIQHLQHATECDSCGQRLHAATRIFEEDLSSEEEQALAALPSSGVEAQRKLAERLGQNSKLQRNEGRPENKYALRSPWRRLFLYALPAVASVVAAMMVSNSHYTKYQLREIQEFVDSEYSKGRPTYYRLAGMPYQRVRTELGAVGLRPSIEITESVKSKAPRLAAEMAFLEDDPNSARTILEHAQEAGDTSAMTLNDLTVAYAMEADRRRSQTDYEKALEISEEVLRKYPADSTAYFNKAIILERLNRHEDARKALEHFRHFERDPAWLKAAEQILPSS